MKTSRFALLAFLHCVLVALTAAGQTESSPGRRTSLSISNTSKDLATKETATRVVEGLPITYPVDEADVVERLLPGIAKYRAARRPMATAEAEALIQQFADPKVRERYQTLLPAFLGLEPGEMKDFDLQYDATLAKLTVFFRQWEKWSGDLSHVYLWNRTTGDGFIKDDRPVFPEISYSGNAKAPMEITVSALYMKPGIGFDLRRHVQGDDPVAGLEAFRLDIPLFYAAGTSADALAAPQIALLERLPTTLTRLGQPLVMPAEQTLTEDLLEWVIRSHYFTAQAAATPKGALLTRALARFHLLLYLKAVGRMNGADQTPMVAKLMYYDFPEGDPARQKFLRDLEALDPFSDDSPADQAVSPEVAEVGTRLATYVLIDCAPDEGGDERVLFRRLRETQNVPPGGFASVTGFRQALEAIYPGQLAKSLPAARAQFVTGIRARLAREAAAKPSAPSAPQALPELSDRQTQVVDGITVTAPASLSKAAARLAPEWAALLAKARQHMEQRYPRTPIPPVTIAEETLTMLRGQGLEVTRQKADLFALQVAVMANAGQFLKKAFDGKTVQIWFKSDLKALLQEGRAVPGFTYEPKDDMVHFDLKIGAQGSFTVDAGSTKPLTGERVLESFISGPPPEYPVVLKDDSIARQTDLDKQVAMVRAEDVFLRSMMEAAATISPEQLGIKENPLFRRSLLTPAQALFCSVHELVEDELVHHVIASPDRRWFCEGLANLMAQRACEAQFGQDEAAAASQVFGSLYDAATLSRRAREVDLLGWAPEESKPAAGQEDEQLAHAHYYFATKVLMAATEGRGDAFLKSWIAKIRETPWNRTNGATILAAYEELTGKSLRKVIWSTVEARPP